MNRDDTFKLSSPSSRAPEREAGATRRPRGGRRAGAGRPPAYTEPLLRKTVTLPQSYVAHLTAYGSGNLSEGIRLLVELACTPFGTPWLPPAGHVLKAPPTGGAPTR